MSISRDTATGDVEVVGLDDRRWTQGLEAYIVDGPRGPDMVRLWHAGGGRIPGRLFLVEDWKARTGPPVEYHLARGGHQDGQPWPAYVCADSTVRARTLREKAAALLEQANELIAKAEELTKP